jgi:hypothetical protein
VKYEWAVGQKVIVNLSFVGEVKSLTPKGRAWVAFNNRLVQFNQNGRQSAGDDGIVIQPWTAEQWADIGRAERRKKAEWEVNNAILHIDRWRRHAFPWNWTSSDADLASSDADVAKANKLTEAINSVIGDWT